MTAGRLQTRSMMTKMKKEKNQIQSCNQQVFLNFCNFYQNIFTWLDSLLERHPRFKLHNSNVIFHPPFLWSGWTMWTIHFSFLGCYPNLDIRKAGTFYALFSPPSLGSSDNKKGLLLRLFVHGSKGAHYTPEVCSNDLRQSAKNA